MTDTMGQNFGMELLVKEEKEGEAARMKVSLPLPYSMDGIIINLPGYLSGLPETAYLSEFIPAPEPEVPDEEVLPGDEFGIGDPGVIPEGG